MGFMRDPLHISAKRGRGKKGNGNHRKVTNFSFSFPRRKHKGKKCNKGANDLDLDLHTNRPDPMHKKEAPDRQRRKILLHVSILLFRSAFLRESLLLIFRGRQSGGQKELSSLS